jgi:hypothetical protein
MTMGSRVGSEPTQPQPKTITMNLGCLTPSVFGTIVFIASKLAHDALNWRPSYYDNIYKTGGEKKVPKELYLAAENSLPIMNGVFWVVTLCGSCKNRRFGGT